MLYFILLCLVFTLYLEIPECILQNKDCHKSALRKVFQIRIITFTILSVTEQIYKFVNVPDPRTLYSLSRSLLSSAP